MWIEASNSLLSSLISSNIWQIHPNFEGDSRKIHPYKRINLLKEYSKNLIWGKELAKIAKKFLRKKKLCKLDFVGWAQM
jgi:hypothetical protein